MTTNFKPTPEQVEAAAKAIADCHNPGMFEKYPENWRVEARAALEAAAGVAPQAVSKRTPEFEAREQELFKHQPLLSMKDGGIAGCKCMDRVFYGKTEDWGTHLAEVFDKLAAPVQPSSAVDEAALAEAEARIAEAAKLHRKVEVAWRDGSHVEFVCNYCSDYEDDPWPCKTAVALGLNEGSET